MQIIAKKNLLVLKSREVLLFFLAAYRPGQDSRCTNSPLRSFGSNQVDFGGMIWS